MDEISVGAIGIRSKLVTDTNVTDLVTASDGQFKVYLESAEGQGDTPYVVMHHIWGGSMNNAPSEDFDMLWRVDAVHEDMPTARELLGHVYASLKKQKLPYPDGWTDWAGATATGNSLEQATIQGVQYWAVGMFIRLRGSKSA